MSPENRLSGGRTEDEAVPVRDASSEALWAELVRRGEAEEVYARQSDPEHPVGFVPAAACDPTMPLHDGFNGCPNCEIVGGREVVRFEGRWRDVSE